MDLVGLRNGGGRRVSTRMNEGDTQSRRSGSGRGERSDLQPRLEPLVISKKLSSSSAGNGSQSTSTGSKASPTVRFQVPISFFSVDKVELNGTLFFLPRMDRIARFCHLSTLVEGVSVFLLRRATARETASHAA
jgi:hypothetical protein